MSDLVHDLELPQIDVAHVRDGSESRLYMGDMAEQNWLIGHPFGFLLTRHEDCVAVLKDKRWHQASRLLDEMNEITNERYLKRRERPSILSSEGEVHNRLRRLVSPAFTPRSADRLRPFMREVINDLVDQFEAPGHCDFVTDVCDPYPIPIICELLGAPKEDWEKFSYWATAVFQIFNDDLADHVDEVVDAFEAIDEYIGDLVEARRADPRDDLLSDLIAAEEEGDRLSHEELVMLAEAVILAGTDTTRNQLACALAVFTDHPDQWAQLGSNPELAARATEESLRYLGAIRGTGRFASEDIVYRDVLFPAGTVIFPNFVGANNDKAVFDDPSTFDIGRDRSGSSHLTLGFGLHYCLGANLARAELQEALTVLSQRMPNLRLDGPIVWKPDGFGIWGPASLPLAFDPVA